MHPVPDADRIREIVGPVRTLWVWRSQNAKLGRAAATYRTQASCPVSCALRTISPALAEITGQDPRRGACYAEHGRPGATPFGHAARGILGDSGIPADAAERMAHGDMVRFNVSGDFLAADGTPDRDYIAACDALAGARVAGCAGCEARPDRPHIVAIAYTHGWRTLGPMRDMFRFLAPRASCDNPAEMAEAAALGYATVTVIPEDDTATIGATVGGQRVAGCPAQGPAALTCDRCRACARPAPSPAIAFRAHGAARKRVLPMADPAAR